MSIQLNRCIFGEALAVLRTLPEALANCCVTSPPYWGLRDYGHEDQLGTEPTPEAYVERLVAILAEVRRVLRPDGTLWLNLGDTYAMGGKWGGSGDGSQDRDVNIRGRRLFPRWKRRTGLKPKDLVGIPWRVAFALQDDGWWLRSDVVWSKPNPMPESVQDRPTKAHEYVFLLSKSERYYYDGAAIAEKGTGEPSRPSKKYRAAPGIGEEQRTAGCLSRGLDGYETRNARSVWTLPTQPYHGAHFATMPPALAQRGILAGAPLGGVVLDPFLGSGTTGMVAEGLGRSWLGVELDERNAPLIAARTAQAGLFARAAT